jgi:hypothetical protein
MFTLTLHRDEDIRRYSVGCAGSAGWEVRMEENDTLQRVDHYHDWHRVERAIMLFEREISDLEAVGWKVEAADAQSMKR